MLWFYRLLFLPILLFSAPYYLLRMKKRGGYRHHFKQRLGSVTAMVQKHPQVRRIWIQAVSVGEMLAIGPILESFHQDRSVEFYLSTTTSTGYKVALERYQELIAGIGYFPIDWWLFSWRAWNGIQPDLVILTEGERWPEHLFQAARRGVPVISLNARLSDRSFRRMQQWRWASRPLLEGISRILACSELDAQRFRQLGFNPTKITTTGNIKLDVSLTPISNAERIALRAELGMGDDLILLGSSTWSGEELALVNTLRALREAGVNCRLLLVPRHAERGKEVEAVVRESGLSFHRRTKGAAPQPVDVLISDTTGELRRLTQLAEIVFVGKSLPPHEQGQTPVEAVAVGKVVLFGPGMSNFRVIAQDLIRAGAARRVRNAQDLSDTTLELFRSSAQRLAMSEAAQNWHRSNQGAVGRAVAVLKEELKRLPSPEGDAE